MQQSHNPTRTAIKQGATPGDEAEDEVPDFVARVRVRPGVKCNVNRVLSVVPAGRSLVCSKKFSFSCRDFLPPSAEKRTFNFHILSRFGLKTSMKLRCIIGVTLIKPMFIIFR